MYILNNTVLCHPEVSVIWLLSGHVLHCLHAQAFKLPLRVWIIWPATHPYYFRTDHWYLSLRWYIIMTTFYMCRNMHFATYSYHKFAGKMDKIVQNLKGHMHAIFLLPRNCTGIEIYAKNILKTVMGCIWDKTIFNFSISPNVANFNVYNYISKTTSSP